MASKFIGRDYSTLRTEIIEFLRKKLPRDWDYQNLADPVVIFAESLARMGDELHYTIDELRRECDVATAKRASSIYSYAMREGYKMMLPRAAHGVLSINTTPEQDGLLHLKLKKFDEIVVNPAGESLYVVDEFIDADLHAPINPDYVKSLRQYYDANNDTYNKEKLSVYQAYIEDTYNKTQRVNVVLGEKGEFTFTYNDINKDSTVELPDPMIDRTLIRLTYTNSKLQESKSSDGWASLTLVDDVISSGYNFKSYTLTPKFIGGAITLNIEFPTNYGDIFENDFSTKFKFEYIKIKNTKIEPLTIYQDNADAVDFGAGITVVKGHEEDQEILDNGLQYRVNFGNGIRGYAEYESPQVTRENYKRFVQNYSALLTKDDYSSYIKSTYTGHCIVYDHGDMYKNPPVLPEDADLIPRAVYIITDAPYKDREIIWNDLKERSSRSDCIVTQSVGKDPYMIVIKADCYLVGTSIASIAKAIESELLNYYSGSMGERIPKISMINYLTHKASDKVIKMESLIVRDTTYGYLDTTFNKVNQLSNDEIDRLFDAIKNSNIDYKSELTDDTQTNDDYQYYLRGTLYVHETFDDNGIINGQTVYTKDELDRANEESEYEIECTKSHYLKYPKITHAVYNETIQQAEYQPVAEFANFPSSYPKIYNVSSLNDDDVIADFDTLILHQRAYGEFDSESWDYADKDIYKETADPTPINTKQWIAFYYAVDNVSGKVQVYIPAEDTTYNQSITEPDDFKTLKSKDDQDKKIYAAPDITSTSYNFPADTALFETGDEDQTHIPYLKEVNTYKVSVELDPDYVKHHYMVPVLNKIVVLIKAVNTKV
jgi:hypothetical protein